MFGELNDQAARVPRRHPQLGPAPARRSSTTSSTSRRSRPARWSSQPSCVLAARGARQRADDGPRAGRAPAASSSRSMYDLGDDVIEADERKIKQILFNLLSNAVKFTPAGGRVDVGTSQRRRRCSDRRARHRRRHRRRTSRTASSRSSSRSGAGPAAAQEGTGLGLGLRAAFVELHGGHDLGRERARAGQHVHVHASGRPRERRGSEVPLDRAASATAADPDRRGQREEPEARARHPRSSAATGRSRRRPARTASSSRASSRPISC